MPKRKIVESRPRENTLLPLIEYVPWSQPREDRSWQFGVVGLRIQDQKLSISGRDGLAVPSFVIRDGTYSTGSIAFGEGPDKLMYRLVGTTGNIEKALLSEGRLFPERVNGLAQELQKLIATRQSLQSVRQMVNGIATPGVSFLEEAINLANHGYPALCAKLRQNSGASEIWGFPGITQPAFSIHLDADPEIQQTLLAEALQQFTNP